MEVLSPIRYVAFLREINSGQNAPVKMQVLIDFCETPRFSQVRTALTKQDLNTQICEPDGFSIAYVNSSYTFYFISGNHKLNH
ncbi:MAG: DUF1697 domain-containing protein [Candidatus Thorarchaeota archaeon]|nr:DUF1697 domain-containing protein [Candidatus Thorarchaeota archaeon]